MLHSIKTNCILTNNIDIDGEVVTVDRPETSISPIRLYKLWYSVFVILLYIILRLISWLDLCKNEKSDKNIASNAENYANDDEYNANFDEHNSKSEKKHILTISLLYTNSLN